MLCGSFDVFLSNAKKVNFVEFQQYRKPTLTSNGLDVLGQKQSALPLIGSGRRALVESMANFHPFSYLIS